MRKLLLSLIGILITINLSAQETGGPYTTDENTVLLMHFDSDATNSATVGNDGIAHGSGISYDSNGIHGQCIRLDNSTADKQSWIEVPFYDELNFTEEFSIECWFKLNSWGETSTGVRTLFRKEGDDQPFDYEIMFFPEGKSLQANLDCIDDTTGVWGANAGTADILELDKWYHIAMYYNHSHTSLYCLIRDENYNEIYATRGYSETPPVNSEGKFMIGFGGWSESCFDGWIDELRISNKYRKYRDDVLADVDISSFKDSVFIPLKDSWTSYGWPLGELYPVNNETGEIYRHNNCGPTMLTRAMHFWEYPRFPSGIIEHDARDCHWYANFDSTEYLWDLMPQSFGADATEEIYGPAAFFSAQVGVAAHKLPTSMYSMPKFLKENFLYSEKTRMVFEDEYSKEEWENILKNELNHGRPIMVGGVEYRSATGGSGHYYIINGYNSKNEFFTDYSFNDVYWKDISEFDYGIAQDIIIFLEPDWDNKTLALTNPSGNDYYKVDTEIEIKWESENINNVILEYSTDAGKIWNSISQNTDASIGTYNWIIPSTVSHEYKVRISDIENLNVYRRTGMFSVFDIQQFEFTYPKQNTQLLGGVAQPIYWQSEGIAAFKLEYSVDGTNWTLISDSIHTSNQIEFEFPEANAENVILKATDLLNDELIYTSESFNIITNESNSYVKMPDENTVLLMHFEENLTNSANSNLIPYEGMPVGYYIDNYDLNMGKAFRFDNSDGTPITHNIWIDNSEDLDLGNKWTMEAWVKVISVMGEKTVVAIIIDKWDAFGINGGWGHFNGFVNFENGTNVEFHNPEAYLLNEWYHVAMISDASSEQIYFYVHDKDFNKIYESSQAFPDGSSGLIKQNENLLKIGGLGGASNCEFDGFMDEVRISKTSYQSDYIEYAELPFYDDFENAFEKWSIVSVEGNDQWHISDDGIEGSLCARLYTNNSPEINDDYLVSPLFNTARVSNISISFDYWYYGEKFIPEFYYSSNYEGNFNSAQWNKIEYDNPINWWIWNDITIELENIHETFAFAFRYQSSIGDDNKVMIDNIIIDGTTTNTVDKNLFLNDFKIYPNPITKESVLSFSTQTAENIEIAIYDIQGRKQFTVIDEKLNQGLHSFPLSEYSLSNGIYLVRLSSEGSSVTLRMIVSEF